MSREDVWVASMKDEPGQLAQKLSALADGGRQLEFVIARRAAKKNGMSVIFATPLAGARQLDAVQPFVSKLITFEAPHFLSPYSMWESARALFRCYTEYVAHRC